MQLRENKRQETSTIDDRKELVSGLLVAEAEDGSYEPVSEVSNIGEAREIAASDFAARLEALKRNADPLCPSTYKVLGARAAGGIPGGRRVSTEVVVAPAARTFSKRRFSLLQARKTRLAYQFSTESEACGEGQTRATVSHDWNGSGRQEQSLLLTEQ